MRKTANEMITSIIYTMLGVIAGIYAVYGGLRMDWPETALVIGAVLVAVGIMKLIKAGEGGFNDGNKQDDH